MADARRIAQAILSDPEIAANSNLAGAAYRDQPILVAASQMRNFTPPRIREMRLLAKPTHPEARIFYEQGKFMEDFEDDAEFREEVVRYFPTYRAMTDAQLRGYFSWRTRVRKGDVRRTSLSFAFMHIYELLNLIGAPSPEEGFRALRNFREAYREIDPRIDSYATLWLKDYAVYYNLDRSFLEGLPDIAFDRALVVLLNHREQGPEEVFSALNSLSSYNLEKSRFYRKYPEDARNVALKVFDAVSQYYNRNPKNSAREKLFGRVVVNSYPMFRSAVFYDRAARENRVYEMGDCHRYLCREGVWSCERFVGYGLNNRKIGAILKTVDYLLRERRGFKSALQPGKVNKILRGKIEKIIALHEEEKRANAPAVIDIDVSRLHGIREAARATRDRLLVDGEEEDAPAAGAEEKPSGNPVPDLDEAERLFLRCLLRGDQGGAVARQRGLAPSILIDRINEKCFDRFSDTVVVEGDGGMEIVEEYRETLEGIFPQ